MAEGAGEDGDGSRDKSPDEAVLSARLGSLDQRLSVIRDNRKLETDQSGNEQDSAQAKASAMASPLVRTGRRCPCRSGSRMGFRSLAVDFSLGSHRILAARLYCRRDECDADGRCDGEAV